MGKVKEVEVTNVYARSMLVDTGFDVKKDDHFNNLVDETPEEKAQIHRAIRKTLKYLLTKDFLPKDEHPEAIAK